ncbi:MAG: ribbon-helix-helix domain-containing protein [Thermosphaera sp.]|nr:ribbon-helix-helix domain-containing protein [Thermosphaera sp.]
MVFVYIRPRLRIITVKMPDIYLEGIDELVKIGKYRNRSEVIRIAVRELLRKELWMKEVEAI